MAVDFGLVVSFQSSFTIDISIRLDGGTLMRWSEYDQLDKDRKFNLPPFHVLEIRASAIEVSLREGISSWRVIICNGHEVVSGNFYLTKDHSEDAEFSRRLEEELWLGIIIGSSLDGEYTYLIVVDRSKDPWERIGLISIDKGRLVDNGIERRTFLLG